MKPPTVYCKRHHDMLQWAESIRNAFDYRPGLGMSMVESYREEVLAEERRRVELATNLANQSWAFSYALRTSARERIALRELKRTLAALAYLKSRKAAGQE